MPPNRLVVFCSSLSEDTNWPFWKFLQMKKVRGVTDLVMMCFTKHFGTFEARIDGTSFSLKNIAKPNGRAFDPTLLRSFLRTWHDPGRTFLVYGGHGMGDYLDIKQDETTMQVHDFAKVLEDRVYSGILFDACCMANLDCAYYLRRNTRYIGACEGYMWEEDTNLESHMFNATTASAMSRYRDPVKIFQAVATDFAKKSDRGDFSILDTTYAEPLFHYVQKHVVPRMYEKTALRVDVSKPPLQSAEELVTAASPPAAIYPYEEYEGHLTDLHALLTMTAAEISAEEATSAARPLSPTEGDAAANRMEELTRIMALPAQEQGLALFNKVVVAHTPPRDTVYAVPLKGLSLTAHELSSFSKPLQRHGFDRKLLERYNTAHAVASAAMVEQSAQQHATVSPHMH